MTTNTEPTDGLLRRTVLKAGAVGAGALALSKSVTADMDGETDGYDDGDDPDGEPEVDEPVGFGGEPIAPYAPFPDNMAVTFNFTFADEHDGDPIVIELDDASTTVVLEARWEPGGTTGWHTHPGPVIVNIVEGELELVWERDCVTRTYSAGETFFDPSGEIHTATNTSASEEVLAYATFFGLPDGAPLMENVAPVECNPIKTAPPSPFQ